MKATYAVIPFSLLLAGGVCAQTRMSGELKCGPVEKFHSLPAGERPDHTFQIGKNKCTAIKPSVVEGLAYVSEDVTYFVEITGNRARGRFVSVVTVTNGDKSYVTGQSNEVLKGGVFQSSDVKWTINGGTGKLKAVTGKGTSKCTAAANNTATCVVEGEYQLKK
jgi:hypothetical protein